MQSRKRWGAGCAFLDYDRDGLLDLIAANYIDLDLAVTPVPSSGLCRYKGIPVACGPPGLPGGKNVLYHNTAAATFEDVSEASGITRARGTYGLGVATLDFDNDGWVDVYVANDSNPSAMYRNNRNGTFTDIGVDAGCAYSQDGKPQAGMGIAIGDYDRDGTHGYLQDEFRGRHVDALSRTPATASARIGRSASGIGLNTRWLGWGVGFVDFDADGWLDLFLVNGHVYPEVASSRPRPAISSAKSCIRTCATDGSPISPTARTAGHDSQGRTRRGLRRLRQRRRHRRRHQQRERSARSVPARSDWRAALDRF